MKFVPSIITVYLPKSDEIVEPESMYQAQSIPESQIFNPQVCLTDQWHRRLQYRKPFTLNGTKKLVTLLVVTRSPIKAIASVQRAGNGIQDGSESLQCPICEQWFHETCFYV